MYRAGSVPLLVQGGSLGQTVAFPGLELFLVAVDSGQCPDAKGSAVTQERVQPRLGRGR